MQTIESQVLYRPESEELRFLPEGPIAAGEDRFSWVGIQHGPESRSGSLNLFDLSTGANGCFPLSGRPGFALPTHQPTTWLVGLERRLSLFESRAPLGAFPRQGAACARASDAIASTDLASE